MHMANELLSPPVAGITLAAAGAAIGYICKKASQVITPDKLALMGIMGAFVFAGQMINVPVLAGTSGHLTGAVLVSLLLGPWAAAIVISSVVIVQCLIFMDGGILALGCNIINMAIVPSFVGYWTYNLIMGSCGSSIDRGNQAVGFASYTRSCSKSITAVMSACLISVLISSILVPIEAAASGVLTVPFITFAVTMVSVHFVIGIFEGLVTVATLGYLKKTCPSVFSAICDIPAASSITTEDKSTCGSKPAAGINCKRMFVSMITVTVVVAGVLSLFASSLPDGLEWSYADRPNDPEFAPIVENSDNTIKKADELHEKYSVMPDYTVKTTGESEAAAGWTSFAGVAGSLLVMGVILITGKVIRNKQ